MRGEFFSRMYFGKMQSYGALTILPVMMPYSASPLRYLTLPEAREKGLLKTGDSSVGGKEGMLGLFNAADCPVLLLQGEEVTAAGQKYTINSTFLLAAMSEVTIPVSSMEQGHPAPVPSRKEDTHGECLKEVEMRFMLVRGQCGLLAFVNKQIIVMDVFSQAERYAFHHVRLVRKCLHDCLGQRPTASDPLAIYSAADSFLEKVAGSGHERFAASGLGEECRMTAPGIMGASLVYEGEPLHSRYISTGSRNSNRGSCCDHFLS